MWDFKGRPPDVLPGRYEIRDQDGDTALVMILEMEEEHSAIGISMGVFFSSLFVCVVRRCCCKGSSSKNKTSEPEAAEPDVPYEEYDLEPVRLQPDHVSEPSGTPYRAQPPLTPTDPLIHNHPSVEMPPTYSEIFASGQTDAPTFPVHSDPEPRFEEVSRVNRTHPSTRPPTRTAVVSAVAFFSVTISPKSQSAKTVFTTQNTRFTKQMSTRRTMVSTQ
ncbi:hypothetical protein F7725_010040 [Dissostichus mawsoni]|uniref:Uncharacterized protein n=1 Tax=Dissostichus mawsoni TaxID=36200 RepID=A0A7J5XMG2_DISMA|nr:hypothetical protein F7725_010040 [Dissostichus mawsoni]